MKSATVATNVMKGVVKMISSISKTMFVKAYIFEACNLYCVMNGKWLDYNKVFTEYLIDSLNLHPIRKLKTF